MSSIDAVREFIAESEEAAVQKALSHYGVDRDQLEVHVIPGDLSVAGLGGRALVLVGRAGQSFDESSERPRRAERSDRDGYRGGRDRDRDRDRDRGGRGRREGGERSRDGGRPREPREARERESRDRAPREPDASLGPLEIQAEGLGQIGGFVEHLLRAIATRGTIEISENATDGEVMIHVGGDGAEDLARRNSGLPAAVSHLAHRAAQKHMGEDASAHVEFAGRSSDDDVESQDSDPALERLARDSAEAVLSSGDEKLLEPMGARDRFIIHNAIRDIDGVTSESVTEGRKKRVKVRPE